MLYSDYTLSNQERTEEQKSSFDRQTRTERTEKQRRYNINKRRLEGTEGDRMNKDLFLENFFHFEFYELEEEGREKNPEAYLLTAKESKLIEKADICLHKAGTLYLDLYEKNKTPELLTALVKDTFKAFSDDKINIKKLRGLVDRFKQGLYWSIAPEIVQKTDKNGVVVSSGTMNYKITTNEKEPLHDVILSPEHPFFKAETMQERARALNLTDFHLYLSNYELNILETLDYLFSLYDSNQKELPPPNDSIIRLVSSKPMRAWLGIGANARRPKTKKIIDSKGKQISIAEYITNNNLTISLEDFLPEQQNLLSVGDPNTDKLLKQAQIIAMQTGQIEFCIPISEFMEFRGLSDNVSAMEQAEKAADMLFKAYFRIEEDTEGLEAGVNYRYMQKCGFVRTKNHGENYIYIGLSTDIYRHLMKLSQRGQQITQYDKRIMQLPDKQTKAYCIAVRMFDRLRDNAGEKTDHVLGVKTLLEACSDLPLYPENAEDNGKPNYLRYRSEAPQRIIKPFIKGLDFITKDKQKDPRYQILESYTFKHSRGGKVSEEELQAALKDYNKFVSLNIEFKFCNEPDYENLKEKKAIQKVKALQKGKQKGKQKKK